MVGAMRIQIPRKAVPVFSGYARYRGLHGGRGSAKTRTVCQLALARADERKRRVVFARQYQNSIRESSHAELIQIIEESDLYNVFDYGESYIVNKRTRSEFIFKGLQHNPQSLKSISNIDLLVMEEAEDIPSASWLIIPPSVRAPGSEIWAVWNPKATDSETRKRLILNPPPESKIVELNWRDNPWFTRELELERQADLARDPDMYLHVWEGHCITRSDAKVFNGKWQSKAFTPGTDWNGPYYGLDFGFSTDPTACVKCWIHDGYLYIEKECGGPRIEIDALPGYLMQKMPGVQHYPVRCDESRPDSISYLTRHGVPKAEGAPKRPGSVEEGITFLRAFKSIIIHPQCLNTLREADLYCYKVDRFSGEVKREVLDKDNHYWDAVRYALAPMIKIGKQKLNIIFERG